MKKKDIDIPTGKDLIPVESQAIMNAALEFCESITEIVVNTEDEYRKSCELTKNVQEYSKRVDTERKLLLQPLKEATDFINDAFRTPQKALENIKDKLRKSIGDYTQMLERKRLAAQRKADETARAERKRLADEAKAKEEKAATLTAQGKTTEAQVQIDKAENIKQIAETVQAPEVEHKAPAVEGVHTRDKYTGELIDKKAFLEYAFNCEQSTVMLGCVNIDMTQINKMIQSTKGKIVLPGIEIHVQKIPVFR